jgi:hypothetical protein
MSKSLTPERALIFRIVHRDNIPWIIDNGLHCPNSDVLDPRYVSIGNPELIDRRRHRAVPEPPGGTLGDYVSFYFTPFSPMLYNIKTGWGGITKRQNAEIAIVASSLHELRKRNISFLFTDRHAYLRTAQYSADLEHLSRIDWPLLQSRDFKRDENDIDKVERYQAEALVHRHLPADGLSGIVCYNDSVASSLCAHIGKRGLAIPVSIRPSWYFA